MYFKQFYLGCLAQASYMIGSEGEAAVVDPRRDVDEYIDEARAQGLVIRHVIETHLHADFVSGHRELAERTGAKIYFGARAAAAFPHVAVKDGDEIRMGKVRLRFLETPGHTPESVSVVVTDLEKSREPEAVLTGDTLFIGDVGRPDLLGSLGFTAQDMGRKLYHSLREKLMTLPDATRVFPSHGAGSACGRNLSTETSSTIGQQKLINYALQPMTEDEFVAIVTEGQPTAPGYFVFDAVLNRKQRPLLNETATPARMSLDEVLAATGDGALLLDTRPAADYTAAHLRGSLQVGLDTRFAEYAGSVIPPRTAIVLIGDEAAATEAKIRLARIGFDTVRGYLPDLPAVLAQRPELAAHTSRLDLTTLYQRRDSVPNLQLVDVRNPGEHATGAVPGATLLPLATLREHLDQLDPGAPVVLYCRSGNRSVIAAALLESRGFTDVSDLLGGYEAVQHATATSG